MEFNFKKYNSKWFFYLIILYFYDEIIKVGVLII